VSALLAIGPFVLGVALGAAVETVVPEDIFTRYLGGTRLLGLLAAPRAAAMCAPAAAMPIR